VGHFTGSIASGAYALRAATAHERDAPAVNVGDHHTRRHADGRRRWRGDPLATFIGRRTMQHGVRRAVCAGQVCQASPDRCHSAAATLPLATCVPTQHRAFWAAYRFPRPFATYCYLYDYPFLPRMTRTHFPRRHLPVPREQRYSSPPTALCARCILRPRARLPIRHFCDIINNGWFQSTPFSFNDGCFMRELMDVVFAWLRTAWFHRLPFPTASATSSWAIHLSLPPPYRSRFCATP